MGKLACNKYACCAETKEKGISTSSYFLHKVTVSLATVWWLVFAFLFLIYFSLLCAHIGNISVWRPLMTAVRLHPAAPTPLFSTFSSLPPTSLSLPPFERLNEKSRAQTDYGRDNVLMVYKWCNIKVCVCFFLRQKWERAGVASISKASTPC